MWTQSQTRLLVGKYVEAEVVTKVAKVRKIVEFFPGRSEKALVAKLRDEFP